MRQEMTGLRSFSPGPAFCLMQDFRNLRVWDGNYILAQKVLTSVKC